MRSCFKLLIVLVLVLAGCGDDADTVSSTTSSMPELTTSSGGPTTTSEAPTTTSTQVTTTTTLAPTTTVATGNYADEPLVVASFGALGWWDGGSWVQVDGSTSLPVVGGEDYQVAVLGLEATTTGGPEENMCDPLDNPGVELSNVNVLGDWPGPYGVAISAPWDLTPHLVEQLSDDGTYAGFASNLLASRGLRVASPVIKQLLRVDLEGDGVNEVIVVAESVAPSLFAEEGDYSIAFFRKAIEGGVQTGILGESVVVDVPPGETPFIVSYSIGAVADLSGDGKMEIVVDEAYYEGAGIGVWEYVNDDLGAVLAIQTGCGS